MTVSVRQTDDDPMDPGREARVLDRIGGIVAARATGERPIHLTVDWLRGTEYVDEFTVPFPDCPLIRIPSGEGAGPEGRLRHKAAEHC